MFGKYVWEGIELIHLGKIVLCLLVLEHYQDLIIILLMAMLITDFKSPKKHLAKPAFCSSLILGDCVRRGKALMYFILTSRKFISEYLHFKNTYFLL